MTVIDQAQPHEWPAAFELAYQHMPSAARGLQVAHALHLIETGELNPAGIWVARETGAIAGVQIAMPLGGASALFWVPEMRARHADADPLVQAALAWCEAQGARLAQAIAPPAQAARAWPLVRRGFTRVTQLLYLEHDLRALPTAQAAPLQFDPCAPATEAAFRDAMVRSYEGTRDCPELNGSRTLDEILAGYRVASVGRPLRWWLVRSAGEPAGVLILTELPECATWDLSYLGVVLEHRRRGVGRGTTCHALHAARAGGAARLVLAVDVRNAPARRLYAALGFVQVDVRDVYLRFLGGDGIAAAGCQP